MTARSAKPNPRHQARSERGGRDLGDLGRPRAEPGHEDEQTTPMGTAPSRHPSRRRARGPRGHDVRVRGAPMVVTGPRFGLVATLLAVVLTAGCSSDSDATPSTSSTSRPRSTSTELSVDGVATAATGDPTANPAEIPFSGTVDCRADGPTGT